MLVTINTDASFSQGFAGYAFWIVSNEFKVLRRGVLRKKVKRAEQAEFKCIINAIHILFKNNCENVDKIIINTDCLNVIHLLTGNKKAIQQYQLNGYGFPDLVNQFNDLIKKNNASHICIEFRHVKAHTQTSDARSYVNDWCDREAKKYCKIRIKMESGE